MAILGLGDLKKSPPSDGNGEAHGPALPGPENSGDFIYRLQSALDDLEITLGATQDAIAWTNAAGIIQWCNGAFDRLVGRRHLNILSHGILEVLPLEEEGHTLSAAEHPATQLLESRAAIRKSCQLRRASKLLDVELHGEWIAASGHSAPLAVFAVRNTSAESEGLRRFLSAQPLEGQAGSLLGWLSYGSLTAALGLIYFIVAKLCLKLAFVHVSATAVWPPAGIAVCSILLFGYRTWPAIFAGAFLANIMTAGSWLSSIAIAGGNTVEALAGAYLATRYAAGSRAFLRTNHIFKFIGLTALLAPVISATIGVTSLSLLHFANWHNYKTIWQTWWLGDAVGILLVSPFLLLCRSAPRMPALRRHIKEILFLILTFVVTTQIVFRWLSVAGPTLPLSFLCYPALIWTAFRFGQLATATMTLPLAGIALWATLHGKGPFISANMNDSLLMLQMYLGMISSVTTVMACVVAERQSSEAALRLSHLELEQRVQTRTAALSRANETLRGEIVSRRSAEEASSRLGAIVASSYDAVIGLSTDMIVLDWNQAAERMYGYPKSKAVGRKVEDLLTLDNSEAEAISKICRQVAASGKVDYYETIHGGMSSEPIAAAMTISPIRNLDGRTTGVSLISRDITKEKKAAQSLQKKQKELQDYIDGMTTFTAKIDTTGRIMQLNRIARLASGFKEKELLKMDIREGPWWTFDPQVHARVCDAFAKAVAGTAVNYDEKIKVFGDMILTINLSFVPVTNEQGKVTWIMGEGRDITAQKNAEAAARDSAEKVRLLLDTAAEGIYGVDLKGRCTFANSSCLRLLGYQNYDQLLGKDMHALIHHTQADGRPYPSENCPVLRAFKMGQGSNSEELLWRSDKTNFISEYWCVPLYRDGVVSGAVVSFLDISSRKKTEAALQLKTDELQRSNRELELFASVASHDMQEPLRKITAFGERLSHSLGDKLVGDDKFYLERMQNAATRMGQLIDDLLNLARLSTKPKNLVELELKQVVEESLSSLEARLEASGGKVEIGPLPKIFADRSQMHQLFQNLISNALKFHKQGAVPLVKVEGHRNGNVEISVTDNGIGFEEKYLERIFQPFQRLHTRQEYEGTGIGLALCAKIVQRHGGTITATSVPGKGSSFIVTLPIHPKTEAAA